MWRIALLDELLSSSLALTVLFWSVLAGFASTLLVLHIHDTRVFDRDGNFIPSPSSSLWDTDIKKALQIARVSKCLSSEIHRLVNEVGDSNIVAFNSPLGHNTVLVAHPDLAKVVMAGHYLKFPRVPDQGLQFIMGAGLYHSHGTKWHDSRATVAPSFLAEHINAMLPNFNRQSQKLVAYWTGNIRKLKKVQPDATSIPVHLHGDLNSLIMSATCFSCFGYDFQSDENRDAVADAFEVIRAEIGARHAGTDAWRRWLSAAHGRVVQQAVRRIRDLIDEKISLRLQEKPGTHAKNQNKSGGVSTVSDAPPASAGAHGAHFPHTGNSTTHPAAPIGTPPGSRGSKTSATPGSLLERLPAFSPQKGGDRNALSEMSLRCPSFVDLEATATPSPGRSGRASMSNMSPHGVSVFGATAPEASNKPPPPRERDLLDALLQCGDAPERKLSRTEIADHLCTFLIAGHESTTACLLWTIYELCRHPEIQSRCQKEIDAVLMQDGVRTRYLGSAELNKIDYTVQVLKESMRLHPVTGNITRKCEAECMLGGYKLKPGTTVVVSILAVHKHPDFWSDPLQFKPDRFSRENIRGTVKHPYQYMPFSAGARSCIGQRVALMEILVVLCTLLSQFTFALAAKDSKSVQEEETFTIHPKDLNVVVSLRQNVSP